MKTQTITLNVLAGILAISMAACSKSDDSTQSAASSLTKQLKEQKEEVAKILDRRATEHRPIVLSLDEEAGKLAMTEFLKFRTQVGDSWFSLYRDDYRSECYQYKGVTREVTMYKISPADKLNGLEWNGRVEFYCSVYRTMVDLKDPKWSDWKDGGRLK